MHKNDIVPETKNPEKMNPKRIAWQMRNKLDNGIDTNIFSDNSTAFTLPDRFSLEITEIQDPLEVETNNEEPKTEFESNNDYLQNIIEEQANEIKKLKKKLKNEPKFLSGDFATDAAAAKIVELSRKIRDLTAELESEKTKTKQLSLRIHELETKHSDVSENLESSNSVSHDTQKKNDPKKDENNSESVTLQEKLQHANLKISEYRNLCQTLKKELKASHKLLQQEIGDDAKFHSALNGTGWKGRAQHILTLQNKLAEMKMHLAKQNMNNSLDSSRTTSSNEMSSSSIGPSNDSFQKSQTTYDNKHREQIKKIEKENKEEKQKISAELKQLKSTHDETKQKLDACKARNSVLGNELRILKSKTSSLLAKGDHDDELIKILTDKISTLQRVFLELQAKTSHSCNKNLQVDINKLNDEHKQESDLLRKMLKEREDHLCLLKEEINYLTEQFSHLQKSDPLSNGVVSPNSAPITRRSQKPSELFQIARRHIRSSDPAMDLMSDEPRSLAQIEEKKPRDEYSEFKAMCQEYRIVAQATQVEKEKLLELVALLNKRLDEAQMRTLQTEQHLHSLQQANVQLEKDLGKANLLGHRTSSVQRLSSRGRPFDGCMGDHDAVETNDGSLQSLREENNLLKTALEKIMHSKEEDVKIYQDIIEQTRKIFMDGLRQFTEEQT